MSYPCEGPKGGIDGIVNSSREGFARFGFWEANRLNC